MIPITEFEQTALEKLLDAECLFIGNRFDGAVYMARCALEIAFKVRLCKENGLTEFPESDEEFKAHDLYHWKKHFSVKLVKQCSVYTKIKEEYQNEWSSVQNWNVAMRYKSLEKSKADADNFIKDTKTLLEVIL